MEGTTLSAVLSAADSVELSLGRAAGEGCAEGARVAAGGGAAEAGGLAGSLARVATDSCVAGAATVSWDWLVPVVLRDLALDFPMGARMLGDPTTWA